MASDIINSKIPNPNGDGVPVTLKANENKEGTGTSHFLICDTDGKLITAGGGGGGGGDATAANQTSQITQETQIATNTTGLAGCVDGNKLRVDILTPALPAGAATALKQDTGNTSLTTLAGCVAGNELQVDVLSGGGGTQFAGGDALVPTGTGTAMIGRDVSGVARLVATDTVGNLQMNILTNTDTTKATDAKQDTGNNSLAIIAVDTTSLDAKKRALSNLGTNELVGVGGGGSAVSASIDTANFGKWSVVCQDNSLGSLYFIIQQSWDNSTWFGDVFTGAGSPGAGNAIQTGEADGTPLTGFFYFNNSDGLVIDPGGFFGAPVFAQYARYIRIQAYDTGGFSSNFNVYWYQTNSA
jgi:hypothetical protein